MSLQTIIETVFPVIASTITSVPVVWPNVTLKTQPTGSHVEVYIMPSGTDSIGINSVDFERGYLQFSIRVKQGTGTVNAADIAKTIANAFPRGLVLQHPTSGEIVRFDNKAETKPAIIDAAWYVIPVLVRYQITL